MNINLVPANGVVRANTAVPGHSMQQEPKPSAIFAAIAARLKSYLKKKQFSIQLQAEQYKKVSELDVLDQVQQVSPRYAALASQRRYWPIQVPSSVGRPSRRTRYQMADSKGQAISRYIKAAKSAGLIARGFNPSIYPRRECGIWKRNLLRDALQRICMHGRRRPSAVNLCMRPGLQPHQDQRQNRQRHLQPL
jgi:hypothetical protein